MGLWFEHVLNVFQGGAFRLVPLEGELGDKSRTDWKGCCSASGPSRCAEARSGPVLFYKPSHHSSFSFCAYFQGTHIYKQK